VQRVFWLAGPIITNPSEWIIYGWVLDDEGRITTNEPLFVVRPSSRPYEEEAERARRAVDLRDALNRIYFVAP
jgi:hypothetical protein